MGVIIQQSLSVSTHSRPTQFPTRFLSTFRYLISIPTVNMQKSRNIQFPTVYVPVHLLAGAWHENLLRASIAALSFRWHTRNGSP